MVEKFTNRASGTLLSGISDSALSLTLNTGQGAAFPALSTGEYFHAVLEKGSLYAPTSREIIKVTARSSDTLTIERGQQGTTPVAFDASDRVEHRLTKLTLDEARDRLIPPTFYSRYQLPSGLIGRKYSGSNDPWGFVGNQPSTISATLATTNQLSGQPRSGYSSSSTVGGCRGSESVGLFRGNIAGIGGFRSEGKIGILGTKTLCAAFVGFAAYESGFILAVWPNLSTATTLPFFGFGFGSNEAAGGNLRFFHNAGTGGPVDVLDTGITRANAATNIIYYKIFAEANASSIRTIAKDLTVGTLFDQVISSNIPPSTTRLHHQFSCIGDGTSNAITIITCGIQAWAFPWAG
jgi:hypothetical protein